MPVQVIWDDEAHTILRQIYSGDLKLSDYFEASDAVARMAKSVSYTVHSIMDRTQIATTPAALLPALRYANNNLPPNIGIRVVIKGSPFTRFLIDMGRRTAAPRLAQQVYFVDTLEEARHLIAQHAEKNSASH